MIILSVETSCDETALSILKASGGLKKPVFSIQSNHVASQIKLHEQYGGVFPMMAKREHARVIAPLFVKSLQESGLLKPQPKTYTLDIKTKKKIEKILDREPELLEIFLKEIPHIKKPKIDLIAVTQGPGLEPALWVGLNFAKALAAFWDIPLAPINHMEGHIFSTFPGDGNTFKIEPYKFPVLALLISGGHTELVLMKDMMKYKKIGQTRDDAVGEAFDKVARMLDLPYPGGPKISRLAHEARTESLHNDLHIKLPRPMIGSPDYDFSFSGLKTAVLYTLKKIPTVTDEIKKILAREFEDSVTDVLVSKTFKAIKKYEIKTLVVGGGVASNTHIKQSFEEKAKEFPNLTLHFPRPDLSTDNSLMIGIVGYLRSFSKKPHSKKYLTLKARGNLEL